MIYRRRNKYTGEVVEFDWEGPTPPTDEDVQTIIEQKNERTYRSPSPSIAKPGPTDLQSLNEPPPLLAGAESIKARSPRWYEPLVDVGGDIGETIQNAIVGEIPALTAAGRAANEFISPELPTLPPPEFQEGPVKIPGYRQITPAHAAGFQAGAGQAVEEASKVLSPVDVATLGTMAGGRALMRGAKSLTDIPPVANRLFETGKKLDIVGSGGALGAGLGTAAQTDIGAGLKGVTAVPKALTGGELTPEEEYNVQNLGQLGMAGAMGVLGTKGLMDYAPHVQLQAELRKLGFTEGQVKELSSRGEPGYQDILEVAGRRLSHADKARLAEPVVNTSELDTTSGIDIEELLNRENIRHAALTDEEWTDFAQLMKALDDYEKNPEATIVFTKEDSDRLQGYYQKMDAAEDAARRTENEVTQKRLKDIDEFERTHPRTGTIDVTPVDDLDARIRKDIGKGADALTAEEWADFRRINDIMNDIEDGKLPPESITKQDEEKLYEYFEKIENADPTLNGAVTPLPKDTIGRTQYKESHQLLAYEALGGEIDPHSITDKTISNQVQVDNSSGMEYVAFRHPDTDTIVYINEEGTGIIKTKLGAARYVQVEPAKWTDMAMDVASKAGISPKMKDLPIAQAAKISEHVEGDKVVTKIAGKATREESKITGQTAYGAGRIQAFIAEAMQNAIDSVPKDPDHFVQVMVRRNTQGEGKGVDVIIRDNGVGMDRDTIAGAFIDPGKSYKPLQDSTGAMGMAKNMLYDVPTSLDVVSTSVNKHTGIKETSKLRIVRDKWLLDEDDPNFQPIEVTTVKADDKTPTGTVTTYHFDDMVKTGESLRYSFSSDPWSVLSRGFQKFAALVKTLPSGLHVTVQDIAPKGWHGFSETEAGSKLSEKLGLSKRGQDWEYGLEGGVLEPKFQPKIRNLPPSDVSEHPTTVEFATSAQNELQFFKDDLDSFINEYKTQNGTLDGIELTDDYRAKMSKVENYIEEKGNITNIGELDLPGATIVIYASDKWKHSDTDMISIDYSSNGLPQTSAYGDVPNPFPNKLAPRYLMVDIRPKVGPLGNMIGTDPKDPNVPKDPDLWPFDISRNIKSIYRVKIGNYLGTQLRDIAARYANEMYTKINESVLPIGEKGNYTIVPFSTPTNGTAFLEKLATSPQIKKFVDQVGNLAHYLQNALAERGLYGWSHSENTELTRRGKFTGLMFVREGTLGMNIDSKVFGREGYEFGIDPFMMMSYAKRLTKYMPSSYASRAEIKEAEKIYGPGQVTSINYQKEQSNMVEGFLEQIAATLLHEIIHDVDRSDHQESFASLLTTHSPVLAYAPVRKHLRAIEKTLREALFTENASGTVTHTDNFDDADLMELFTGELTDDLYGEVDSASPLSVAGIGSKIRGAEGSSNLSKSTTRTGGDIETGVQGSVRYEPDTGLPIRGTSQSSASPNVLPEITTNLKKRALKDVINTPEYRQILAVFERDWDSYVNVAKELAKRIGLDPAKVDPLLSGAVISGSKEGYLRGRHYAPGEGRPGGSIRLSPWGAAADLVTDLLNEKLPYVDQLTDVGRALDLRYRMFATVLHELVHSADPAAVHPTQMSTPEGGYKDSPGQRKFDRGMRIIKGLAETQALFKKVMAREVSNEEVAAVIKLYQQQKLVTGSAITNVPSAPEGGRRYGSPEGPLGGIEGIRGTAGTVGPENALRSVTELQNQIREITNVIAANPGNPIIQSTLRKEIDNLKNQISTILSSGGTPPGSLPPSDPVSKLLALLEKNKDEKFKVREWKDSELRAWRMKKAAKLAKAEKAKDPMKWFSKGMAALKGKLEPDAIPEEILNFQGEFSEKDLSDMFQMIKLHPGLDHWQKMRAAMTIKNLLDTKITVLPQENELRLLEMALAPDRSQAAMARARQVVSTIADMKRTSPAAIDYFIGAVNVPRVLAASYDLSGPLRQGWVLTASHPILAFSAFKDMFKGLVNEEDFTTLMDQIENHDIPTSSGPIRSGELYKRAGLDLAGGATYLKHLREEPFQWQFAEKIPGVRHSERAYVTYLNKLRSDVFDAYVEALESKFNPADEANDHVYKAVAKFINNATGRGKLGAGLATSKLLNTFFFSPRFQVSRLMLLPDLFIKTPPEVRRKALLDLTKAATVTLLTLGVAKAFLKKDASIELDPRSTDFLKLRVGNSRLDMTAGFQPWIRFLTQFITHQRKSTVTKDIMDIKDIFPPKTRLDLFIEFALSKGSPITTLAADLMRGKTAVGDPLSWVTVANKFVPMIISDMADMLKKSDSFPFFEVKKKTAPWMIVPGVFGAGVQTYEPRISPRIQKLKNMRSNIPTVKPL